MTGGKLYGFDDLLAQRVPMGTVCISVLLVDLDFNAEVLSAAEFFPEIRGQAIGGPFIRIISAYDQSVCVISEQGLELTAQDAFACSLRVIEQADIGAAYLLA